MDDKTKEWLRRRLRHSSWSRVADDQKLLDDLCSGKVVETGNTKTVRSGKMLAMLSISVGCLIMIVIHLNNMPGEAATLLEFLMGFVAGFGIAGIRHKKMPVPEKISLRQKRDGTIQIVDETILVAW